MSQAGTVVPGGGSGNGVLQLTPDDLNPVLPAAGNINVFGLNGITTSNGGASTLRITGGVGLLQTATLTLNSAQVKTLKTNVYTIVPAQGLGTVIIPYSVTYKVLVPTGDAFTNLAGAAPSIDFYDGLNFFPWISSIGDVAIIQPATSYFNEVMIGAPGNAFTAPQIENLPLVLDGNQSAGDYAGNAAGDNTWSINVQYVVQLIP